MDSKWLLWSLSQCLLLGFKGLHLHIFSLEYLFFSSWQQYKYVCKRLEVLFKVTAEITACQKMVLLGYLYLRKLCVIIKISENFSCKLKIVASPLFSKMQVISHSVKTQLWPWTASLSAYWSNFWNLLSITRPNSVSDKWNKTDRCSSILLKSKIICIVSHMTFLFHLLNMP